MGTEHKGREERALGLLDRIFPHLPSYGNIKLLQGLLICGIFEIEIIHVRELPSVVEPNSPY